MTTPRLEKLRHFIHEVDHLHREHHQVVSLLDVATQRLAAPMRYDDWLLEEYTLSHSHHYQQYLLHADSGERFSIASFVWEPGQAAPIHDHRVRGAVGMLRGAGENQRYQLDADSIPCALGAATPLEAGQAERVSVDDGDTHRISNALADHVSISIHIYDGNIGAVKHAVYTPEGQQKPFISGCFSRHLPNIWNLPCEHQG